MHTYPDQMTSMVDYYDLKKAIDVLENDGLILYPTDTNWSIGCDASSEVAVTRAYHLKNRPYELPMTVLVDSIEMLRDYVEHLHPRIETLLSFHLRPLTIVYDKATSLPERLTAADGSIAIRIPQDDFCRELIQRFGRPIVASSANIEGASRPQHFGEISSEIIQGVDLVMPYRRADRSIGEPSVVARLSDKAELIFIRE
ncbi:MAG: threonylcarbamoyl-AMP synthase [Saprospiraceae bacterium]|nr:threonylcarbamoyl-AMP synthase [Saprospiraceae bacterium]